MTGDEVGDNLLVQVFFVIDTVEDPLKLSEQLERRFTHQHQYAVTGMFRCYFQASTDVFCNQLTRIFHCRLVGVLVLAFMQQQVVAHTTAYKAFFDSWQCVYCSVYL